MDWVKGVQHAIDYMETHMTEEAMVFIGHGYVCGSGIGDLEEKRRDTTRHWMGSRKEQEILKGIRPEENVWYDIYTDYLPVAAHIRPHAL